MLPAGDPAEQNLSYHLWKNFQTLIINDCRNIVKGSPESMSCILWYQGQIYIGQNTFRPGFSLYGHYTARVVLPNERHFGHFVAVSWIC